MIGSRTQRSLAQFLELQGVETIRVLLDKHGIPSYHVSASGQYAGGVLSALVEVLEDAEESNAIGLISEIALTQGDLRYRVNPRYRFDERWTDLQSCLLLDGYLLEERDFRPIDPSIEGVSPIEDDFVREIRESGLLDTDNVIDRLRQSGESFRAPTPDYNASLTDARIALETLARTIAEARSIGDSPDHDPKKWGSVIRFLKEAELFEEEVERALVGVYGFLSLGAHRPIGLTEAEATRLGRNLAMSMGWFLVKQHSAVGQNP